MRRDTQGILNPEIAYALVSLGHTQKLGIVDAGFPIPTGVKCIDISLKEGVPSFQETVEVVLREAAVEAALIASEMSRRNPTARKKLTEALSGLLDASHIVEIPHEQLKRESQTCAVIIRTGECSPYSNVIFQMGVTF